MTSILDTLLNESNNISKRYLPSLYGDFLSDTESKFNVTIGSFEYIVVSNKKPKLTVKFKNLKSKEAEKVYDYVGDKGLDVISFDGKTLILT